VKRYRSAIVPLLIACGFAIAYGLCGILRHRQFDSSYDLAIYDQALWHLSRFEGPASSFRGISNIFGDHFHPIIVVLAPLYWMWPTAEALIVAQAVLLACSIVPVYLYARDRLPYWPAVGMSVAYGLFWGLQQTALFDFHEAAFAPLAVALLLLALHRRQWPLFWVCAIVAATIKEDMTPFLAFLGGYLFFTGERRRGAILFGTSLAAFVLTVGIVIPAASDAGAYGYEETYSEARLHPWRVPIQLVTPPLKLLTTFLWFAPFAMLPLVSPLSLLVLPFAAERFLSASQNHWGTIFHYSAPLAPIVAMAAIDGLARIASRLHVVERRRQVLAGFASACVLCAAVLPGHQPIWRLFASRTYRSGAVERTGRDALQVIPDEASVVAQANVGPHLSHRAALFRLDAEAPEADYVVAVDRRSPWPLANYDEIRALLAVRQRRGYEVVFDRDGWIVLRRAR
jgi:uncharacterized membrane protein